MTINDVMYQKLGELGYMGTLNERMYKFFSDYAPATPPAMGDVAGTVPDATGDNLQEILNDLAARVKALETPTP